MADTLERKKQGMISHDIVRFTIIHRIPPGSPDSTGSTVMDKFETRKRLGHPAQLVGLRFIDGVPAETTHETAQLFPTFPAINFCPAANMKGRSLVELHALSHFVVYRAAANSEAWCVMEVLKTLFEIVGGKGQITVEIHEKFPVTRLEQ